MAKGKRTDELFAVGVLGFAKLDDTPRLQPLERNSCTLNPKFQTLNPKPKAINTQQLIINHKS